MLGCCSSQGVAAAKPVSAATVTAKPSPIFRGYTCIDSGDITYPRRLSLKYRCKYDVLCRLPRICRDHFVSTLADAQPYQLHASTVRLVTWLHPSVSMSSLLRFGLEAWGPIGTPRRNLSPALELHP